MPRVRRQLNLDGNNRRGFSITKIKNYYCTYSDSLESQEAVIDILFNGLVPNGISPVTLL